MHVAVPPERLFALAVPLFNGKFTLNPFELNMSLPLPTALHSIAISHFFALAKCRLDAQRRASLYCISRSLHVLVFTMQFYAYLQPL